MVNASKHILTTKLNENWHTHNIFHNKIL